MAPALRPETYDHPHGVGLEDVGVAPHYVLRLPQPPQQARTESAVSGPPLGN